MFFFFFYSLDYLFDILFTIIGEECRMYLLQKTETMLNIFSLFTQKQTKNNSNVIYQPASNPLSKYQYWYRRWKTPFLRLCNETWMVQCNGAA